jgi:hypothetical protein
LFPRKKPGKTSRCIIIVGEDIGYAEEKGRIPKLSNSGGSSREAP